MSCPEIPKKQAANGAVSELVPAGIAVGFILFASILVGLVVMQFDSSKPGAGFPGVEYDEQKDVVCRDNLRRIGEALIQISASNDYWPQLSVTPGRVTFSEGSDGLFSAYFQDSEVFLCPSNVGEGMRLFVAGEQPAMDDHSYFYLGYVITSDDELEKFLEAYQERIASGLSFDEDLPIPGSEDGAVFHRLRNGVEDIYRTSSGERLSASEIPVMWERINVREIGYNFHHNGPSDGNVLFLDGHVEGMRFYFDSYPSDKRRGGGFPLTESAAHLMDKLDNMANR